MKNEVFPSQTLDLSRPPPGWGGAGGRLGYRGRHNGRAALNPRQLTPRPPRLCNVQDQNKNKSCPSRTGSDSVIPSGWGEVWRPDVTEVGKEAGQAMIKRELSSNDDGEWKVVKNGRRNSRGTPSPPPVRESHSKKTHETRDHRHVNKRSPDQARKSPSYSYKGGKNRHSPDNAKSSAKNNGIFTNHEELIKKIPHPQIIMASDLPDEKIARRKSFTQERSIPEQEENIQLHSEILSYLRATWQETCIELEECQLQWQPNVVYFTL